MPKIIKIR